MSDRFNALKIRPPPEASGNVLASPAAPNWAGAWDENMRLRAESNLRHRQDWLERGLINPDTGELTPAGRHEQAMTIAGGFGPADVGLAGGMAGLIKNYHGSPHLLPPTPKNPLGEFNPAKVGTGEGSQAFGQGAAYTADKPATSETYLGPNANWKYGGINAQTIYDRLNQSHQERGLDNQGWAELNARRGFWEKVVLGRAPRNIIDDALAAPWQYGEQELAYIKSLDPDKFKRTGGHMYEVNIHAEPGDFLHWDKPLSGQSPKIQKTLGEMEPDLYHPDGGDYDPSEPGSTIYHRLTSRMGGSEMAASMKLKEKGVAGVRYLDAGSRGGDPDHPDATHNHVTFDPEKLEIIRRFGLAGIVTGGAAAAAGTQQGE